MERYLLARERFNVRELVRAHAPRVTHRNKKFVFGLGSKLIGRTSREITASRWRAMKLPAKFAGPAARLEPVPGFFTYGSAESDWHLNFADPYLFVAYGGSLLAQDELQVAEHPALGSLLEALQAKRVPGFEPRTCEDGEPTPVLVRGVERCCFIDTSQGLYGNAFAEASLEEVERATRPVDPPSISNILAISAPPGGYGVYTREQIENVLVTAYTGFRAAGEESGGRLVIHTGHWGCGAFGGNRILMSLLQAAAARLASVDRLVFHFGDAAGRAPVEKAQSLLPDGGTTRDFIDAVLGMKFEWGVSDGN